MVEPVAVFMKISGMGKWLSSFELSANGREFLYCIKRCMQRGVKRDNNIKPQMVEPLILI